MDAGADTAQPAVVNLTPHEVVVNSAGREWRFASSGIARLVDRAEPLGSIDGMPVARISLGEVTGLPAPQAGTVFLVSRVLASYLSEREDLVFPFGEIRDADGRIVAVSSLATFAAAPTWESPRLS